MFFYYYCYINCLILYLFGILVFCFLVFGLLLKIKIIYKVQFRVAVFNMGYSYPRGYVKTSYINQNGTQEPLQH
jgi:hypothetical protein